MAFTIGSGTFTNGSATVTGVTLTSGTLAYFASGTRMVVGVNPVIQEVEAIAAPTVSTITLRSAWTGTGGTYSFLANQTSEGLRDAVQAIRTNNASLQSFIDSIDTAATANSVAQRTSNGSLNVVGLGATGDITLAAGGKIKFNDDRYFSPENNVDGAEISVNGVFKVKTGVTPTERFRIDGLGNVGIGTSSPAFASGYIAETIDGATGSFTEYRVNGTNTFRIGADGSTGGFLVTQTAVPIIFGINGGERMRIDSSGNVGIGTSSPESRLDSICGNLELGARIGSLNTSLYIVPDDSLNRVIIAGSGNVNKQIVFRSGLADRLVMETGGNFRPAGDNTQTLGGASNRWSVVYAGTGTINTSDAREKTTVEQFTADELNAAKQLSKEIGTYKFLSAVAKKGDDARKHIGMTVQRAIEIMEANNLDPFAYGFICYDAWEQKTVEHPAVEAKEAEYDEEGNLISEAVEAKDAYTEVVQEAGDRYSFRPDEMLFFIARGLEARIEALEG